VFVNKNLIPYDRRTSTDTSGIRMGTPAMTALGLIEDDFRDVAHLVADVLEGSTDRIDERVAALCRPNP
jgi:glycine hydroxymethyltransferase